MENRIVKENLELGLRLVWSTAGCVITAINPPSIESKLLTEAASRWIDEVVAQIEHELSVE